MNGIPDKEVRLCIKDLLFKVKGSRASEYEWRVDGKKIESDGEYYKDESDYKDGSDKNTFGLSIIQYESKFEGKYECIVSTTEEPIMSTSVEIIVYSGKCAGMSQCS